MNRAADILMVTREAVRKNIKELGNQLGMTLFISHSRGVEPTDKAKGIYPQIKDALKLLTSIEQDSTPDTLEIAVSDSTAEVFVKEYLKEFCAKHPTIKLELSKLKGMSLKKAIQQDFIIEVQHLVDRKVFKTIDLFTISGAFVATKDFIKKHNIPKSMTKEELFKYPIITREEAWKYFLENNELKTKPFIMQASSTDMAYSMTKDSIGIGYFAKELLNISPNANLVKLDVTGITFPSFKTVCAYTKTLSQPAKDFINGFITYCQP
jgi:DNA-binding transcriptional LysR family regulator